MPDDLELLEEPQSFGVVVVNANDEARFTPCNDAAEALIMAEEQAADEPTSTVYAVAVMERLLPERAMISSTAVDDD